jgi:hypothetical protein
VVGLVVVLKLMLYFLFSVRDFADSWECCARAGVGRAFGAVRVGVS